MDNWVLMHGAAEKVLFEIKLLAYFHHPNIIRYIDHFIEEKYVILVTELHGTEWSPRNPILNSIRNPGLKKLTNDSDHHSKNFKGIPKRTSCDLFECIGNSRNFNNDIRCSYVFLKLIVSRFTNSRFYSTIYFCSNSSSCLLTSREQYCS